MDELDTLREAAARKLNIQAGRAARNQSYYDNEAGIIALLGTDERRVFKDFLAECSADWCALVVNAVAERLQVVGFNFGTPEDSAAAWAIWQASQMDADAEMVQTDALAMGSSFVLVQPDEDNPTGVSITPESPLQACVLYEPGDRRTRVAGYKRYAAGADSFYVEPSGSALAAANAGSVEVLITPDTIATWGLPGTRGRVVQRNPAGFVGMIELTPWPRTLGWPRAELDPAKRIQDRINTTCFARLVATDFGAFRTIWASGVRIAQGVVKGGDGTEPVKVVKPFDLGANRLLASEDPASRFGGIPESTLAGYLGATEQDVQHLAATTQTPPHYLVGHMINLAADAIKAAEAGLVAKVGRRSLHLGEGWEEVARCALSLIGNPAATNPAAEVLWADFETRSEGQRVDALTKMGALGVPRRVLWQKWGATPQQITEWEALLAADPSQHVQISPAPFQPRTAAVPEPGQPQPAPAAG